MTVTKRTAAADAALGRLPRKVKVGGFDIMINRLVALEAASQGKWGAFSSLTQTIEIQCGMPSVYKLVDTFFHEVSHAIFWAYGAGKDDTEERIVSMLGTAWLALHRDNPWLAKWISETLCVRT